MQKLRNKFRLLGNKFNDIHLRHKLLISHGSLLVFAVFIIGSFSYYSIQQYVYKETSNSFNQTLIQFKINIENRLNTYHELVNQITTDKNLIYALSNQYESAADYSYQYLNTISEVLDIKRKDENVLDAFILKNNHTLPEVSGDLIDIGNAKGIWWFDRYFGEVKSYKSINEYIKLSKLKIWIITNEDMKPQYVAGTRKAPLKKVAVIRPVIRNHEKLVGIFVLYIKYNSIFGEFETQQNPINDRIFIIDQSNKIIFDNVNNLNTGAEPDSEYLKMIDGKNEGKFEFKSVKSKRLVLFCRGEGSGWTYFREIPMETLFASARAIRRFTIFIALISIAVSFIIGAAIARFISRRVAVLSERMEQVVDLTLTLTVDVNIDGRDEIGNLARSFNRMIQKIRELVDRLKQSQQLQKEAEMKALQAQINPHFLYNTLATINWMAMDNNTEKIISMVDNLSVFYRLSLNKGWQFLRIGDEINQLKAYAEIQKIRLDDKINVFYRISENIKEYYTLKLILQPFVENAILHGAGDKNSATNIVIKGCENDGKIILEVIDDGVGMRAVPEPSDYPASGGYGIRNVHEKIRLQYGSEYGVEIFSRIGIGTIVIIKIPIVEQNPNIG